MGWPLGEDRWPKDAENEVRGVAPDENKAKPPANKHRPAKRGKKNGQLQKGRMGIVMTARK